MEEEPSTSSSTSKSEIIAELYNSLQLCDDKDGVVYIASVKAGPASSKASGIILSNFLTEVLPFVIKVRTSSCPQLQHLTPSIRD